jgi:hypothetical protein
MHTICFSLKMNLFYKIHLQAFNVISIVFITVVQRLGKSCIPVWTPSLLMCLITQVTPLDTSSMLLKRFPRSGFFKFWEQVKVWWAEPTRLWLVNRYTDWATKLFFEKMDIVICKIICVKKKWEWGRKERYLPSVGIRDDWIAYCVCLYVLQTLKENWEHK